MLVGQASILQLKSSNVTKMLFFCEIVQTFSQQKMKKESDLNL